MHAGRLAVFSSVLSVVATLALLGPSPASATTTYDMTVSSGTTANVTCTSGVCTPTGSGANLRIADLVSMLGTGNVTVGTLSTTGTITLEGSIDETSGSNPLTFNSLNGIAIHDTADSNNAVTLTSGGTINFGAAVAGPSALTLDANSVFSAGTGGVTALSSLATGIGDTTQVTGSITTSGTQTYGGAVTLSGDTTFTGNDVTFQGTVDGTLAYPMTVEGDAEFDAPVGGVQQLQSLSVSGATLMNTPAVSTTGTQSYGGPAIIGVAVPHLILNAGSSVVSFGSTLDGPGGLQVEGSANFVGAIGTTTPLASLLVNGPANVSGSVATSGNQTFVQAVNLVTPVTFAPGGTLQFEGPVVQNSDMTMAGTGTMELQNTGDSFAALDVTAGTVNFVPGSLGSGTITLDGGTLQWSSVNITDVSTQGLQVLSGGGTLDLGANNVTLATPVSGTGLLTKTGAGTLTLPASGGVPSVDGLAIAGGPLDLQGVTSSPITVAAGGTLNVSGTADGHVTVASSGTLNCTNGWLSGGVTNNGGTLSGAPAAPTAVVASSSTDGTANVTFTPGTANCNPVTYAAKPVGGSTSVSGTSPIALTGLGLGQSYTFAVTATNPVGSATSLASNSVFMPLAPTISITAPTQNATYTVGQVVDAAYGCADGPGAPGITSCTGTVANGAAIDTASPGQHSFEVQATSGDGEHTTQTYSYDVVAPQPVTTPVTTPVPNSFRITSVSGSANGTVRLVLQLPGAGIVRLTASAAGGRFRASTRTHAGACRLTLKPSRKQAARIRRARLRRLRVTITFTPTGGVSRTVVRAVRL